MNLLFVCTGNICRSAMAEAIAHHTGTALMQFQFTVNFSGNFFRRTAANIYRRLRRFSAGSAGGCSAWLRFVTVYSKASNSNVGGAGRLCFCDDPWSQTDAGAPIVASFALKYASAYLSNAILLCSFIILQSSASV